MNWFLLVFILKVLSLIHGAPIEVVDFKDDLPAETVILKNSLQQEFVATENANNLTKGTVDLKEEAKIENNSVTAPTTIESLNENMKDNSQNFNVNETFISPVNEEQKSAENLKLNTKLNQTLNTLNSALSQPLNTFKEELKSLEHLDSSKISEDSQNSDNIDSTTILVRVDETPEEYLDHKTKAVLNSFDSEVKPFVETFATGLKSLKNFGFNKNSQDSKNFNISENVETATETLVNLDQKSFETINSAVKPSADIFIKGLKSLENLAKSQNSDSSENVEATSSLNFDQTAKESEQSKPLETINSAVKISVDNFKKGLESIENFHFHQSLAESQNLNINKNIETTTLANLDKTFEEIKDSKTLETINSAVDKSVDKGLETSGNFGFHQNSAASQNFNINENVEAPTLVNFDLTSEKNTESKTLEIINSAVKPSVDTLKEGFKILQNFGFNSNSQDLGSLNMNENIETTTKPLMNLNQYPEEILKSNQPLNSLNSAVKQSGNTFRDGLKYLDNFSVHENSEDSQNLNINGNIKTTTETLANLDQTRSSELKAPVEGSETKQILDTINSATQESVNSFNEGFSFQQISADSHNSNINENVETVSQDSYITENSEATATTLANLEQKSLEGSESKTFETLNSTVEQSVDTLNGGLSVLKIFGINRNSENSKNSENNENVEEKYEDSSDLKTLETINSVVKQSADTINEGLSFNKTSEDSQNLNSNVEQITRENLEMKSILNPILDALNSTASESIERSNKVLKNFENLSLNKNSEEPRNTHRNYQIIDDSIMADQTHKDSLNFALNHSAVIFNEGIKLLENFTNIENTTTDSVSSIGEVEVAKIEEIFITTQTPIVNFYDKVKHTPVNRNEYLREESEISQQHFEQNSENNSEATQLLSTSNREKEAKLFENHQETERRVTDKTAAQKEANIANIFNTTESALVNLKGTTVQISQENLDRNSTSNSAVDLFTNGVILMKNSLDLQNSSANKTNSSPAEILTTNEAPVLNLFESLCLVPKDIPLANLNNNDNVTPAYEELKNNVEEILNRMVEETSLESGDQTSTERTKRVLREVQKILITTEAPVLNLFESLCLVPKHVPQSNHNENENVTPAYEELKHNVEDILNVTIEENSSERGGYIEQIPAEDKSFSSREEKTKLFENHQDIEKRVTDKTAAQNEANIANIFNTTESPLVNLKETTLQISQENLDQNSTSNSAVDLLPNGVILMNNSLDLEKSAAKKTNSSPAEILTTTEVPILNLFESLCPVPKDIPLANLNNNNNVTPAYEELKHNVEEILNRTVEETSLESEDYIEEIPTDLSSNDQTATERTKKVLREVQKILTTTETPVLNLFESLCLVPKHIPPSNSNKNENVTPAYEELKHNVEDILNATIEENSSDRGGYIEQIPAEDKMYKILISNEQSEGHSVFKHSENSFLDLGHNNESDTESRISAAINFNQTINKNLKNSQLSNEDNTGNNEQAEKLGENFHLIPENSQQFKISTKNADELSSINYKEEEDKMQPNFITSPIPTEILNGNFTEISKDSNAAANEKEIEPEVGQDILQIAAKLIEEEDKIIDLNQNSEKNVSMEPSVQIKMNIPESFQTDAEKLQLSPESENSTANNETVEQNYESISVVKNLDDFQNESNGNSEEKHLLESPHKVVTEMPTISLQQLLNYRETIKEVPKEILTTTENINLPTSQEIVKIYKNVVSDKESEDVNIPTQLSTIETKMEDFMTAAPVNKLIDFTTTETKKNIEESETQSNLQQNQQKKFSTFAISQPETIINHNQFTTNPSTSLEETTLSQPSKFEKELNMAVKALEATTQHHFQQFHQNLQKAFKTFNEWEAEHMKQDETTTITNTMRTTTSLQEDNYTTAETTLQPLTHMEIIETTTTMKPIEETTFETSNNGMEEIPNLGVINENFVDKYQENFQENFMKTEVITTMASIKNIEEESSTYSPLIILKYADDNTPHTTTTTNVLTTMTALPKEDISNQEEFSQLHVLQRAAIADKTTSKNYVNEDHSTAVAKDYHENTTTENDGETTIVPLFARIQLQKDINSVSLVKYDNDFIEKEIVGEQFVNTNNATAAINKTIQQQSNGEDVNETIEKNDTTITTHSPSEETTEFSTQEEEKMTLSTPETYLQNMVTFIQHEDTTTFKQDDSSQTQLPLTQAAFMEEQQQQIESTTENNVQTHTTVTGEHNYETEIADKITSTTTTVNETITATMEPDVYSTTIVEAEIDTATTTLAPIQIEPEVRSRALPPPKLEYLQNEDGVEVFYGYSIVKRN